MKSSTKKVVKKRNAPKIVGRVKAQNIVPVTKKNKILKYDAIACTQNGVTFYQATVDIDLLKMFFCDIYDHKTGKGWNRNDHVEMRGEDFCTYMETPGSFCPVPIVINDRSNVCNVKKVNGTLQLHFDMSKRVYVTEGQGRTHGFLDMLKKGTSIEIPVIITKGPISTEIKTGFTINYKRRPVSTNITLCQSLRVVTDQLENGVPMRAIDRQLVLEAVAYKVVHRMNNNKHLAFYKNFIMPNEQRQTIGVRRDKILQNKRNKTVRRNVIKISAHSRPDHIQKIAKWALRTTHFTNFNKFCKYVSELVMDFWKAMEEVNPTIFENPATITYSYENRKTKRKEILLQGYHTQVKNGCFLLYPILIAMLEKKIVTKKEFKKYLSKSSVIKDVDFWKDDQNKRDGCQVLTYNTFRHTRMDIMNEIGLGLK